MRTFKIPNIIILIAVITLVGFIYQSYLNNSYQSEEGQRTVGTEETASEQQMKEPEIKPMPESVRKVGPTIFIHGYNGGLRTFEKMLKDFSERDDRTEILTITVQEDGKLKYQPPNRMDGKIPLVQVIFINRNASFENQLVWIKFVVREVADIYGADAINLVGHSMGGVIATKYVLETNEDTSLPKVEKLVTLASPIKGWIYFTWNNPAAIDLQPTSAAIQKLQSQKDKFPQDVKVFSAYGFEDDVVSSESATGLQEFTKNIMISSYNATHKSIRQNTDVFNDVYSFLRGWKY
ncbi:alpha/beta fold hydrolase [Neobacillus thermocopriae]|uniref:alpha/beta fold hydrolase n=1 Tax=Neobacillus thermocopriae TaxID=1215031 RepID=UPI00376F9856